MSTVDGNLYKFVGINLENYLTIMTDQQEGWSLGRRLTNGSWVVASSVKNDFAPLFKVSQIY